MDQVDDAVAAIPMFTQPKETFRFIGEVGPLFEALAKAQAEFVPMERDSEVDFKSAKGGRAFKYASLAEVLDSVRPALNKHGIALLQPFDGDTMITMLCLGSARYEVSVGLPTWNGPQDLGSALTYIKRYQLKSLLGVNDGEDDDGNAAQGTGFVPMPRERQQPPATRPAAKDAPVVNPDALKADTQVKLGELSRKVGFKSKQELEDFSRKNQCGPLADMTEMSGLRLVVALEKLQIQPGPS